MNRNNHRMQNTPINALATLQLVILVCTIGVPLVSCLGLGILGQLLPLIHVQ